jgi:hypothetical protein
MKVTTKYVIKSGKHQVKWDFFVSFFCTLPLLSLRLFSLICIDYSIGAIPRQLALVLSFAKFFSLCRYFQSLSRHTVNCSNSVKIYSMTCERRSYQTWFSFSLEHYNLVHACAPLPQYVFFFMDSRFPWLYLTINLSPCTFVRKRHTNNCSQSTKIEQKLIVIIIIIISN